MVNSAVLTNSIILCWHHCSGIIAVYKLWLTSLFCYYCCLQAVTDSHLFVNRIKVHCSIHSVVAKRFMNSPIKMHVTKRVCLNLEGWLRHKSFLYSLQYFTITLKHFTLAWFVSVFCSLDISDIFLDMASRFRLWCSVSVSVS